MTGTLAETVQKFSNDPSNMELLLEYEQENQEISNDELYTQLDNFFNQSEEEQTRLKDLRLWLQKIMLKKLQVLLKSTLNLDEQFIKNIHRLFPNDEIEIITQVINASITDQKQRPQILTILNYAKLLLNNALYLELLGKTASMLVLPINWDSNADAETTNLDLELDKIFTADFLKAQRQSLKLWETSPYSEYFQRKIESLIKNSKMDEIQPYILSSTLLDYAIDEMIKNPECTAKQFKNLLDWAKSNNVTSTKYPNPKTLIETGLEKLNAGMVACGINLINKEDNQINEAKNAIERLLTDQYLIGDRTPCIMFLRDIIPSSMIASMLQTHVFSGDIIFNPQVAELLLEKIDLQDKASLKTLTARFMDDNQRTVSEMQEDFHRKLQSKRFDKLSASFRETNKMIFDDATLVDPLMNKLNKQLEKLQQDLKRTTSLDEQKIIKAKIELVQNLIKVVQNRDLSKIKLQDYPTFARATAQRNLFSRLFNRESKTMELAAEVYRILNPNAPQNSHDFKKKLHESMSSPDNSKTEQEEQKPKLTK